MFGGIAAAFLGKSKSSSASHSMEDGDTNKKRKLEDEFETRIDDQVDIGKKGKVVKEEPPPINNDLAEESKERTYEGETPRNWGDELKENKNGKTRENDQPEKSETENGAYGGKEDAEMISTNAAEQVTINELPNEEQPKHNPYTKLRFCVVENDGSPDSCVKLIGLKSLFAKQLPKMPRPYIARLVFDRRHKSLAILSDDPQHKGGDEEIIGAICYRGFEEMRFAEIAFCAVNSSHQVKGYGTKLMNLLKRHAVTEGIEYFITYADNYAIGYFKKQGFTKTISMPKGRYQGLIKDYDGGTPMECYIHPSVDFTRIPDMLQSQRDFIMERIRLKAKSHIQTYDPLQKDFRPSLEGISRANESAARAMAIPGIAEAGWNMADLLTSTGVKDADRQKNALKSELLSLVRKTEEQQCAWPFREPVNTGEVHDYLDVIKEPIDLTTVEKRIRKGDWYKSKQMLYRDLMLMVNNCKLYNDENSTYYDCAVSLGQFVKTLFPDIA